MKRLHSEQNLSLNVVNERRTTNCEQSQRTNSLFLLLDSEVVFPVSYPQHLKALHVACTCFPCWVRRKGLGRRGSLNLPWYQHYLRLCCDFLFVLVTSSYSHIMGHSSHPDHSPWNFRCAEITLVCFKHIYFESRPGCTSHVLRVFVSPSYCTALFSHFPVPPFISCLILSNLFTYPNKGSCR
jgi:hypothetical protein